MSGKLRYPIPDISPDGKFLRDLPVEGEIPSEKCWYKGLSPWQRLNSHYTYSSVRRFVHFKPFLTMKDHLDFMLGSIYQHNKDVFPEKIDVYFQPVTVFGDKRKIAHKKHKSEREGDRHTKIHPKLMHGKQFIIFGKLFPDHPLRIGGIPERMHPSSVKLMNSSHHSPQTNAGYVRQDRDGNLFQY